MFRRMVLALSVAALGLMVACGSDDDPEGPAGGGGGGVQDDWCQNPPSPSNAIGETQMDSTYPTPAGGEIVDGIYELVRFEVYSPASADENLRGRLLKFENGTFYSAMRETRTTTVIGGSYTTSGDTITLEIECPQSNVIEMKYTVSGDEFWFHDTSEPNVQAYVRLP